MRALVEDHFAILKVGPELTFAFREAVFALEQVERELLERRGKRSASPGVREALDRAMCDDPRHWKAYYGDADEESLRLRRAWSLSDRARYYWPVPQVQEAVGRLFANLDGQRLPLGLVSQYLAGRSRGRWRPAHGRDRRPASHASGSGAFSPAIPGRARPQRAGVAAGARLPL